MAETITINGKKIGKGEKAEISLRIARLPTHTFIDLPVFVYRGERDGPVLLLTAGLHGDEINGIEIIRRMIASKTVYPLAGTVIALPIVNVFGFIHFLRDLPDGKDLNRSFPGGEKGSLARRIAYVVMNEILPHVDYGIDFHTGGASRSNFPQLRCLFDNPQNLELAQGFAPPFIIDSKLIDKSFRQAAYKKGKVIIVYEGGESLRFDEFVIQEGVNGTVRLMKHLGMTDKSCPPNNSKILQRTSWIRASYAGMFRSVIKCGELVKKNQVIGNITDPFGETEIKVKSPKLGYIIGVNNIPVVNRGDAIFHLGMEG